MPKNNKQTVYDGSLSEFVLSELRTLVHNSSPGQMLPSENALMHKYSISRSTANKALNILAQEGLVERQRGRGTLAAPPKIITYLLPCPDFMNFDRPESAPSRMRYAGITRAAEECNLEVETIAVSATNSRYVLNYNQLSHLNPCSMVIADIWFEQLFQYLFERQASVVMFNKEFVRYGFRQYTRRWHSFELSDHNTMKRTLECLYAMGRSRIGVAGNYLLNEPHLTFNSYENWCKLHNMPVTAMDLNNRKPLPRKELAQWQKDNALDAVIWIGPYFNSFATVQEMLGLPEEVMVFGWNFIKEYFPELAPFPCSTVPFWQMGYDAVHTLAKRPRLSPQKRTYSYIFSNVPDEFISE